MIDNDFSLNIQSGEQQVEAPVRPLVLPVRFVGTLKPGSALPSVLNVEKWRAGGEVVTITNFINGQDGQTLEILGDGFTTIEHGTFIKTFLEVDLLLEAEKIYRFTRIDGIWYQ